MLLQPITVPFSKSTLKPSVYTLMNEIIIIQYSHCTELVQISGPVTCLNGYELVSINLLYLLIAYRVILTGRTGIILY